MHCPYCGYTDTKVIDSRLIAEGLQTRRRRECPACGEESEVRMPLGASFFWPDAGS